MTMDLKEAQKQIYQNKVDKHWNVSDIEKELCLMQGEIAEFYEAYRKRLPTLGEELADVAIYLLGIAEILHVDLEAEIRRKMSVNQHRQYADVDGINTRISDQ
jgi:NTP pyrophosphatase (non-canonical NTP hydrolase)